MTQQPVQPYYPPAPQQNYPQQLPQPAYPQQQPAQQYPAPAYPQQQAPNYPQQQPAQPPVPLANGSLDDYYSQPSTGGGPGVSWKGKPDGYTVQGTVPRDVADGDVTQEVGAPNTQQAGIPQFYRDGRPKLVMSVPLALQPSQEFPEGEARLFVRGQLRDELARAMGEAQVTERAPKAGSVITVTLVQRKQGRGTIPQNIFAVVYTPAGGTAPQGVAQPASSPQFPSQEPAPQWAQPQQQGPPQVAQQYAQPVQQQAPTAPSPAVGSQQPGPDLSAMTPEQQALFAQITGQQPQAG